jgi:hypothetical protein
MEVKITKKSLEFKGVFYRKVRRGVAKNAEDIGECLM